MDTRPSRFHDGRVSKGFNAFYPVPGTTTGTIIKLILRPILKSFQLKRDPRRRARQLRRPSVLATRSSRVVFSATWRLPHGNLISSFPSFKSVFTFSGFFAARPSMHTHTHTQKRYDVPDPKSNSRPRESLHPV